MKGPRNRPAFERGQTLRHEIVTLLLAHSPLGRPLTAKQIQPRLSRAVSLQNIWYHLRAIRESQID